MDRRQEILLQELRKAEVDSFPQGIYNAMEEYAKEEVANNSMALVNIVLDECGVKELKYNPLTIGELTQCIKIAKDTYFTERALELLEYIGNKCMCFDYDEYGQLQFQLQEGAHWVTKEQLFENFL